MATENAINLSSSGVVSYDGAGIFTGSTLTQHDVLVGGSSNAITSVAPSATSGVPLISQGASSDPAFGTAIVAGGGTGDTSFTSYSVICGGTTSTGALQNVSGVGTSGQVLTSNGAAALPTWQAGGSGGMTWVDNPGSITGAANTGYFISVPTTITLPASPSIGTTISFVEYGSANITIQANTGQQINIGPNQSAIAGTAADNGVCILTLVSRATSWYATSVIGVWNLN